MRIDLKRLMVVAEYCTHKIQQFEVARASEEWLLQEDAPGELLAVIDLASDKAVSSHVIESVIDLVIERRGQSVLNRVDYFWVLVLGLALNLVRFDEYRLAEFLAIGFTEFGLNQELFKGSLADVLYIDDGLPKERITQRVGEEFDLDCPEIIGMARSRFSSIQGKRWVPDVVIQESNSSI